MEAAARTTKPAPDPLDPAVVLTYEELAQLGKSLNRRITTREELFASVAAAATMNLEGVKIQLEPKLLMRLKSRCLDKANFPRWMREMVIRQLHDFAGW